MREMTDLKGGERESLARQVHDSFFGRAEKPTFRFDRKEGGRYSLSVDGIRVGWIIRRDDLPLSDRWHGYIPDRQKAGHGRLVVRAATRMDAAEDVAIIGLRDW